MRWKTRYGPRHGERQERKSFALFPVELSDGYTVWLEHYWEEIEWREYEQDSFASSWQTVRTWCEKKARPNE